MKMSWLGLKYPVLVATNTAGDGPTSCENKSCWVSTKSTGITQNADSNCSFGSLRACNPSTPLIWKSGNTHARLTWYGRCCRNVNMAPRPLTCINVDASVVCRSINCSTLYPGDWAGRAACGSCHQNTKSKLFKQSNVAMKGGAEQLTTGHYRQHLNVNDHNINSVTWSTDPLWCFSPCLRFFYCVPVGSENREFKTVLYSNTTQKCFIQTLARDCFVEGEEEDFLWIKWRVNLSWAGLLEERLHSSHFLHLNKHLSHLTHCIHVIVTYVICWSAVEFSVFLSWF